MKLTTGHHQPSATYDAPLSIILFRVQPLKEVVLTLINIFGESRTMVFVSLWNCLDSDSIRRTFNLISLSSVMVGPYREYSSLRGVDVSTKVKKKKITHKITESSF